MASFPRDLPPLPPEAPQLSPEDRAYVDALPADRRHEAEWTLRAIDGAFARAKLERDRKAAVALEARRRELAGRRAA
jgi:hypothetical protein